MSFVRHVAIAVALTLGLMATLAFADGKVVPPRAYQGSLEERAQEAIIFFHGSDQPANAIEDLILKINVRGQAKEFAWVVPFPHEPQVAKEDPKLFTELFSYVEFQRQSSNVPFGAKSAGPAMEAMPADDKVQLLSRKVVGSFDVAVVRETEAGGLNPWLEKEGFQPLQDAEETLAFYRRKNYVFACIKVNSAELAENGEIESHPLRFTFNTGGRDGIYFPMKMTGLQETPFDVNLYVFYRFWLNDRLSQFGYEHRGFRRRYRDWDSRECVANGGKSYSLPESDPFLRSVAHLLPTITALTQKLHPGEKYYLTNIQAQGLKPQDVRQWADDLWLFPYYTNRSFIPHDARRGAVASAAWPNLTDESAVQSASAITATEPVSYTTPSATPIVGFVVFGVVLIAVGILSLSFFRSRRA